MNGLATYLILVCSQLVACSAFASWAVEDASGDVVTFSAGHSEKIRAYFDSSSGVWRFSVGDGAKVFTPEKFGNLYRADGLPFLKEVLKEKASVKVFCFEDVLGAQGWAQNFSNKHIVYSFDGQIWRGVSTFSLLSCRQMLNVKSESISILYDEVSSGRPGILDRSQLTITKENTHMKKTFPQIKDSNVKKYFSILSRAGL